MIETCKNKDFCNVVEYQRQLILKLAQENNNLKGKVQDMGWIISQLKLDSEFRDQLHKTEVASFEKLLINPTPQNADNPGS